MAQVIVIIIHVPYRLRGGGAGSTQHVLMAAAQAGRHARMASPPGILLWPAPPICGVCGAARPSVPVCPLRHAVRNRRRRLDDAARESPVAQRPTPRLGTGITGWIGVGGGVTSQARTAAPLCPQRGTAPNPPEAVLQRGMHMAWHHRNHHHHRTTQHLAARLRPAAAVVPSTKLVSGAFRKAGEARG